MYNLHVQLIDDKDNVHENSQFVMPFAKWNIEMNWIFAFSRIFILCACTIC